MATTTVTRAGSGAWVKIAFAMFAVGWGANQFSPMLIVYRHELRLGTGAVAGLFLVYALTLIPGSSGDRPPIVSGDAPSCSRSWSSRRWPRCCWSWARDRSR
jgi:hypothetical protein